MSEMIAAMGYKVITASDQLFAPPSWNETDEREVIELPRVASMQYSPANLWRFPPGCGGRRHREPVQEEVFCVLEGVLTMFLGEPPERFELEPKSVVVVEPRTPLQLRNETEADVIFFAYGAPHQGPDYKAEVLESV